MHYVVRTVLTLSILFTLAAAAAPSDTGRLVQQLAGPDHAARAQARQLLPYRGVEAVPLLLPLLSHEDAEISWAATRVLEDIANEVSAPGRETDRRAVADAFMTLLAPEQPDALKEQGLRLLPIVVPRGYPLRPVAVLLGAEPVLREKARAALREIGTGDAAASLADALDRADPAFQADILHALARMRQPVAQPAAARMLRSAEPAVRAAACQALAWQGSADHLPRMAEVHAELEGAARFESGEALLRQLEAMGARGGHWRRVVRHLSRMAADEPDRHVRAGALVLLGRFADETAVPLMLAAAAGEDGPALEPAVLAGFEALQGPAAAHALLDAYPAMAPSMQAAMLRMFGRKGDARYLDVLKAGAAEHDPALREAALDGLAASRLPEAADVLVANAEAAGGDARAGAAASLRELASAYEAQGARDAAGKAFLGLYRLAEDEEAKLFALEGIKRNPEPEAFEVVMGALGADEFSALPADAVAGFARAMHDAGDPDRAAELVEALMPRLNDTAAVKGAIGHLGSLPGMRERLGVVAGWHLVGAWPWSFANGFEAPHVDPAAVDVAQTYTAGDETLAWQWHESPSPDGLVQLHGRYPLIEHCTAYAYTEVTVPEDCEAQVRAGSDDGIRVWVNGEVVLENHVDRGADLDQDTAPARLRAGVNRILVQSTQHVGGWNFLLRLTQPDGAPLEFERMTP